MPGGGNSNPFQYSCLENPMDRGAWQAVVHGVSRSRTYCSDLANTHTTLHFFFSSKEKYPCPRDPGSSDGLMPSFCISVQSYFFCQLNSGVLVTSVDNLWNTCDSWNSNINSKKLLPTVFLAPWDHRICFHKNPWFVSRAYLMIPVVSGKRYLIILMKSP